MHWRTVGSGFGKCLLSRIASVKRLGELSSRLGDVDWRDGAFNAGDILMVGAAPTG
jgi:hypothetical protein